MRTAFFTFATHIQLTLMTSALFLPLAYLSWQPRFDSLEIIKGWLLVACLVITTGFYSFKNNLRAALVLGGLYLYLGYQSAFYYGHFCEVSVLIYLTGFLPAYRILSSTHFKLYAAGYLLIVFVSFVVTREIIYSPFAKSTGLNISYVEVTWATTRYTLFFALAAFHLYAHLLVIKTPRKSNTFQNPPPAMARRPSIPPSRAD